MATDITSATISSPLKSDDTIYWSGEALPNNTNKSTAAFKLGQTMAGCEIRVDCETGTTLAGDLLIELQTCATSDGTFVTKVAKTVEAGAIVAGNNLAGLILPREVKDELYGKVKVTIGAVQATGAVDAYMVMVP